ncbi:MAG: hypothetical protein IT432_10365 [Phycisphaerales bacterium]|nr:hypothetical protein [Phycisphaerales bacterium]
MSGAGAKTGAMSDMALGRVLPEGLVGVPLLGDAGPVRLAIVAHEKAGEGEHPCVILRETLDARIFLGAVLDAASRVLQWVEVWVQDVDGLADSAGEFRDAMNNAKLDERFAQRAEAATEFDRTRDAGSPAQPPSIVCGFEKVHPRPTLMNRSTLEVVRPIEKGSNGAWVLCTDDAALANAGLPAYSSTLHRYLYVRELKDQTVFVPVTRGAPTNTHTVGPDEAINPRGELAAINMGGGLMCVRSYEPLSLETYVDQVGGFTSGGAGDVGSGGMLTLGRGGKAGRLLERLHLKLRLIADLVSLVRGEIAATQTPMLNVTASSFGVRAGQTAWGLPSLWSTHAVLRHSGDAAQVTLPGSDLTYFVSSGLQGPTVYAPGSAGSVGGAGSLQIRQVKGEDAGLVVEATLRSQERLFLQAGETIALRVPIGGVRLDLYAIVEQGRTGAPSGEIRFHTVPLKLSDREAGQLKAAEGVMIPGVMFRTIAMTSSPCDLFSLGVLAIRALLVDGKQTLAVALDELQSLVSVLAAEHDPSVPLGLRVRGILEDAKGAGALAALGPQRVTADAWEPRQALEVVTPEVWGDVIGMMVRCMVGSGPDAACRDFGEARAGMLHRVFDRMGEDVRDLVVRTRMMVVGDVQSNREVSAIVSKYLGGAGAAPARK